MGEKGESMDTGKTTRKWTWPWKKGLKTDEATHIDEFDVWVAIKERGDNLSEDLKPEELIQVRSAVLELLEPHFTEEQLIEAKVALQCCREIVALRKTIEIIVEKKMEFRQVDATGDTRIKEETKQEETEAINLDDFLIERIKECRKVVDEIVESIGKPEEWPQKFFGSEEHRALAKIQELLAENDEQLLSKFKKKGNAQGVIDNMDNWLEKICEFVDKNQKNFRIELERDKIQTIMDSMKIGTLDYGDSVERLRKIETQIKEYLKIFEKIVPQERKKLLGYAKKLKEMYDLEIQRIMARSTGEHKAVAANDNDFEEAPPNLQQEKRTEVQPNPFADNAQLETRILRTEETHAETKEPEWVEEKPIEESELFEFEVQKPRLGKIKQKGAMVDVVRNIIKVSFKEDPTIKEGFGVNVSKEGAIIFVFENNQKCRRIKFQIPSRKIIDKSQNIDKMSLGNLNDLLISKIQEGWIDRKLKASFKKMGYRTPKS